MDEFQWREQLLLPILHLHGGVIAFINSPSYLHRHLQRRIWAYGLVHVG